MFPCVFDSLMAQHVVRERVRPEDVLQRVSKHRLFPQAEASIRLRIPDIQKNFNLGLQVRLPHANTQLSNPKQVKGVQVVVSNFKGAKPVRRHGSHTDPV